MEVTLNQPFISVFKQCQKILRAKKIDIKSLDERRGIIYGSTSSTIWSWGEEIKIQVSKINDFKTKIEVTSETPNQLFSWGKNAENEENIIFELRAVLK